MAFRRRALSVNTTAFPTRSPANSGLCPPQHGSWAVAPILSWLTVAPCPSGACGGLRSQRPSRSAKDQVAAAHGGHAGRLTGAPDRAAQNQTFSGVWLRSITGPTVSPVFWRHLRQRRTTRAFCKVEALPPCRSAGRQLPSPTSGLSPGRRRASNSRWNSGNRMREWEIGAVETSMARSPISGLRPF